MNIYNLILVYQELAIVQDMYKTLICIVSYLLLLLIPKKRNVHSEKAEKKFRILAFCVQGSDKYRMVI